MNHNMQIQIPQQILCTLNHQSQTYTCSLPIKNNNNFNIYFYIVSTFGTYCKQTTNIHHLDAGASSLLNFNIKSTNIISKHHEKIVFFISSHKKSMITQSRFAKRIDIKLNFQQQFIQDAEIESIVQQQVHKLLQEGYKNMQSINNVKQAKHIFQQGFQLLRKNYKTIEGMAKCCFLLEQWEECLVHIATAFLYNPQSVDYQFLKAKTLIRFCGDKQGWEGQVIEQAFCTLKQISNTKKYELSQQQNIELDKLIKEIELNPHLNRLKVLKQRIIEKAIDKYNEQLPIAKIYKSKKQFSQQIRQLLTVESTQQRVTPDEALDPISYEIMNNPFILPSGNSFQAASLQIYFQKNGYKDPFTRQGINIMQAIPNNNLKLYIFQHPLLKIWRQYQKDLLTQ